jgi:hypothetical protein
MNISEPILNYHKLKEQVARLDGYLDAVASISGKAFRYFQAGACLLELENEQVDLVDFVKAQHSSERFKEWQFTSAESINWLHIERNLFQKNLLTQPFGFSEMSELRPVAERRYEVAWQATEILDIILDPERRGKAEIPAVRVELTNSNVAYAIAYGFRLGKLIILVTYSHIPRDNDARP